MSIMSFVDKSQARAGPALRARGCRTRNAALNPSGRACHREASCSWPGSDLSSCFATASTQLEPGCSVLLHNKVLSVVGILSDEADPLVSVMKARGSRSIALARVSLHRLCARVRHALFAKLVKHTASADSRRLLAPAGRESAA